MAKAHLASRGSWLQLQTPPARAPCSCSCSNLQLTNQPRSSHCHASPVMVTHTSALPAHIHARPHGPSLRAHMKVMIHANSSFFLTHCVSRSTCSKNSCVSNMSPPPPLWPVWTTPMLSMPEGAPPATPTAPPPPPAAMARLGGLRRLVAAVQLAACRQVDGLDDRGVHAEVYLAASRLLLWCPATVVPFHRMAPPQAAAAMAASCKSASPAPEPHGLHAHISRPGPGPPWSQHQRAPRQEKGLLSTHLDERGQAEC